MYERTSDGQGPSERMTTASSPVPDLPIGLTENAL